MSKEQHLFDIENNVKDFTATFDQISASSLNKSIFCTQTLKGGDKVLLQHLLFHIVSINYIPT